ADVGNYSITDQATTLADITPAGLIITANNISKPFGDILIFNGTEFTASGLKNNETINSVTLASAGATAAATIASYPIIPGNATGGTFTASNYAITFVDGVLSVIAVPVTPEPVTAEAGVVAAIATVATQIAGGCCSPLDCRFAHPRYVTAFRNQDGKPEAIGYDYPDAARCLQLRNY
ncbi:MAG: hypothetical protein L0H15_09875, partial [Nitrosospira sp.]|nr:hypothetical protein [Nitrosospira sp.]